MTRLKIRDDVPVMEPLEQRSLMDSVGFASVGLAFESRPYDEILTTVYSTEGTFNTDTETTTGTTYAAGHFDRFVSGPLLFNEIIRLDDGRYLRNPNRGTQGNPVESNGAQFLTRDGFGAGWWYADFGHGEKEIEWIVERPTNAVRADFQGVWRFAAISTDLENDDFSNSYGEIEISSSTVRFFTDGGSFPNASSGIVSTTANGRLLTNEGEYFYMSADGGVMIFADMSEDDGFVHLGIAVREEPAPFAPDIAGEYLLAWAFADGQADYGPNGEVNYAQRFLRLEADGDYRIWDLDDYDSGNTGNEWSISRGEWRVSNGEVRLESFDSGDLAWFFVGDNYSTLVGFLLQDDDVDDPVLGMATRAYPIGFEPVEPGGVFVVPGEGSQQRPLVYQLGFDEVWEVTDLLAEAGGPSTSAPVVSWIDPKDGHAYAAAISASGLILYSEPTQGDWYYRNISIETSGQNIVSDLQVMVAPDGIVHLTGLNSAGQLVRYYQFGGQGSSPPDGYDWGFVNIETADLVPQGMSTPDFAGPLVSYATSWGGLNVAGLDAQGRVWSVWWAPGMTRWEVDNLSESTGAAPLSGSLTVYLTPWGGINIAGLDNTGDLQVTWWVPGQGGEWRHNNLTAETGGPRFELGSVTSYVSSWGGLNVAGIDINTGEVMTYWWVPERTDVGWAITSISDSLEVGAMEIVDFDIRGIAAPDGSLNIFGYGDDGSYLNYYWYPGFEGEWRVENLSETAVDR